MDPGGGWQSGGLASGATGTGPSVQFGLGHRIFSRPNGQSRVTIRPWDGLSTAGQSPSPCLPANRPKSAPNLMKAVEKPEVIIRMKPGEESASPRRSLHLEVHPPNACAGGYGFHKGPVSAVIHFRSRVGFSGSFGWPEHCPFFSLKA